MSRHYGKMVAKSPDQPSLIGGGVMGVDNGAPDIFIGRTKHSNLIRHRGRIVLARQQPVKPAGFFVYEGSRRVVPGF